MALYSIKQETLTDIGDALRRKYGETKWVVSDEGTVLVSKSQGSTGFNNYGGQFNTGEILEVIKITGANSIKITLQSSFYTGYMKIFIAPGIHDAGSIDKDIYKYNNKNGDFVFEDTDTITIKYIDGYAITGNYGYYMEIRGFDANGNALKKISNTYKSSEMAQAIDNILPAPPAEAFVISGDCSYRFANNGWNWFIEKYSNKITTKDISNAQYMFFNSNRITGIPFDLNFDSSLSYHNLNYIFNQCYNLTQVPKLNNVKVCNTGYMFNSCNNLRTIPDDIADTWDWSYLESQTQQYNGSQNYMFQYCYSLRSIPMNLIKSGNPYMYYYYNYYYNGFYQCFALDELINLPIPYTKATWTSNAFYDTFNFCTRLKNITFALNNGVPYIVTWKAQVIDLSNIVGYTNNKTYILNYNSGITADKEVKDDATYQALKNDPDWWTMDVNYSRYNHDSAVATINSLPDTSAYLATAGGTNTIKFRGQAGASTDGGAINTLTEEEIAVAAAKGWTCSFV